MSGYRDETEALRARVQHLEGELAEARRDAGRDQNVNASLLKARVESQERTIASQAHTIAEFNKSVASLREDLKDAEARARVSARWNLLYDWWDKARIAFFFGVGFCIFPVFFYALATMNEGPVAGFVVGRYHRRPRTDTTCSGEGASRRCTTTYTSERWTLHVAGDDQVVVREVPEDEWARTAIGSWYCLRPEQGCPPIPALNDVVEE